MDQKLIQQLEAHAEYLSAFFTHFFDHIDPESGPVKGKFIPIGSFRIVANFFKSLLLLLLSTRFSGILLLEMVCPQF